MDKRTGNLETIRRNVPNAITFLSLTSGMTSLALAINGFVGSAAVLILVSYLLDSADGMLARKLGVTSDFGIQLDSLADVTCFGVAGVVLVWAHLGSTGYSSWLIWPVGISFTLAGAYRLARFNLYAGKTKPMESLGLTISTSGGYVALAVLADRAFEKSLLPDVVFLFLLPLLAALMVSRIRFPELRAIIGRRRLSLVLLSASAIVAIWFTPQVVWWGLTTGYISFGLLRAGMRSLP
jgi:CDP-diacylglycerol--serine O-phosphatidyltransferase